MNLLKLLNDAKETMIYDANFACEDFEITGITENSKEVSAGNIFVCIRGKNFDGHSVAKDMLNIGAACVICEKDLGLERQVIVSNSREFYGLLCAAWFDHPEKELKLVGVTGTNGKTTMATLIKDILNETGHKVGFIGTTGATINGKPVKTDASTSTTPRAFELYSVFAEMLKKGCSYVVMEVSSFALEQNRIGPAIFDVAVFTNLTRDHLDYHGDMGSYFRAKCLLFEKHCKFAIINTDCDYGKKLYQNTLKSSVPTINYGLKKDSYITAEKIRAEYGLTKFWITVNNKSYPVVLKMIGTYNVSNAIAAIGACVKLGININNVIAALGKSEGVIGRCEIISRERGFLTICDYAHSPDALENMLPCIKEHTSGRVICLFGCGGDRDKTKRPLMAAAAEKYSDFLVITSDNPRNENPDDIISEIVAGLSGTTKYVCISNRKAAINHAISIAKEGDIVVLAGKGHEDYQILENNTKISFDERKIVAEIFANYKALPFNPKKSSKMTVNDLVDATNGTPVNIRSSILEFEAKDIFSDTRAVVKNGVFVAIKGASFDGHDYVSAAIKSGALFAITEREIENFPCLVVKDTRKALLEIAYYYRRKFKPVLVGVTGSVAKTTTKNMVALALSSDHSVFKTEGNHNNEIGLPFTLFKLNDSCSAAVIEMGMSDFGEISRLSKAAAPNICLITNIGYSHIENLGSREGILSAKLEILDGASKDATLILNADDLYLKTVIDEYKDYRNIISYSINDKNADFRAVNIKTYADRISFDVEKSGEVITQITLYCIGKHNIYNALAAISVAVTAGCDPIRSAEILSAYQADEMRQSIEKIGGNTLIVDCYNASPTSMKAAIEMLCDYPKGEGKSVAILGDMLELGENSEQYHSEIGDFLVEKGVSVVACYGKMSLAFAKRVNELGLEAEFFADKKELVKYLKYKLKPNDVLLFKASRGIHLEKVIEEFYSQW